MANIKISELNELTKSQMAYDDYIPVVDSSASETKKISVESLTANNVYLLAVVKPNGQVPTPETGAKYYRESTNKIYYAPDDENWYEYGTPIEGIFYVVLGEKGNYTYDADNEILVSVGGGSGSQVVVEPDEPTEDTKLLIEESDLDFQGLEISNEYTTGNNVAYSCDFTNDCNTYSTTETDTGKKWIDGKTIYRKCFSGTITSTSSFTLGTISNVSNIIKMEGYSTIGSFITSLTQYWTNEIKSIVQFNTSSGEIKLNAGSSFANTNYVLIIEYTKTS